MTVETARDLFEYRLQEIYYVETELDETLDTLADDIMVDALDDVQKTECRHELREAIETQRSRTTDHVERLEAVFEALDSEPEPRRMAMFDRWIDEKERFNNVVLNDELRPPFYLGVTMTLERMEITVYEGLIQFAELLDLPEGITDSLETNLTEDREMLQRLDSIAESEAFEELLSASADRSREFSARHGGEFDFA